MNRINRFISKENDRMHFIPFVTAGDPNLETTIELALMLQDLGASALELGIPYSDPLADGPVIQRASLRALAGGMTLEKAMTIVPEMRARGLKIPVIIFTYCNPLIQLGERKFLENAQSCEIDGLLVPDLPFEESEKLRHQCRDYGIALISLVAPTTSLDRLDQIGREADGFLYCVSSLGVTGARAHFHPEVRAFLGRVRSASHVPIAVGFGISSHEQVEALKGECDGFIIGSAIVSEIEARQDLLINPETRTKAITAIKDTLNQKLFANLG